MPSSRNAYKLLQLPYGKQARADEQRTAITCSRNDAADDDLRSMQRGGERRVTSPRGERHPNSTAREGTEEGCLSSGAAISLLCLSHPHNLLTTSAQVSQPNPIFVLRPRSSIQPPSARTWQDFPFRNAKSLVTIPQGMRIALL